MLRRMDNRINECVDVIGVIIEGFNVTNLSIRQHSPGKTLSTMIHRINGKLSIRQFHKIVHKLSVLDIKLGLTVENHDRAFFVRLAIRSRRHDEISVIDCDAVTSQERAALDRGSRQSGNLACLIERNY